MAGLPTQVAQAGKDADDLIQKMSQGSDKPEDPAADPTKTEPTEDVQKELETLRHKYQVLKGKYDKEVKADYIQSLESQVNQMKQQIRELTESLQANQNLINDLSKQTPAKPEPAQPVDLTQVLTEEQQNWLKGEELEPILNILTTIVQKTSGSDVARQLKDISTKVETVEKQVNEDAQTRWQRELTGAIPDFFEINQMPEFATWLDKPVAPGAMTTRRQDLQQAMASANIPALKSGIDAFKKETGLDKPKETFEPKTPEIEPNEDFVGEPPKEGKVYTEAEIKKFYEDQTKGLWRGREKEAQAIDRDIVAAMKEGRIHP